MNQPSSTESGQKTDFGDRLSFHKPLGQKSSNNIRIKSIKFFVNQDFVLATVGQEKFKLLTNNLNSIFLAAVLEEFNNLIGNRTLVKQALLLIKLWTSYDVRKYRSSAEHLQPRRHGGADPVRVHQSSTEAKQRFDI